MLKRLMAPAALAAALAIPASLSAQTAPAAPAPASSRAAARAQIGRWLDLQAVSLNARYRFIETSGGVTATNQLQHREVLRGRIKADRAGRYAVNFGLFTGARFTSGWDNTTFGIGPTQKNLAFKQLYFAAQPVAGIEAQVGGLYVIRGESTEITTYDEDAYIMGERISVRRPRELFFDEISFTNAYLNADVRSIGVSHRFRHIDEPNYRHFLVDKKIGKRAGVSLDYTTDRGNKAWRQGINIKTPALRYVDTVIFENYQSVAPDDEYGFALSLEKAVHRKVILNGGYASIDPRYGVLNSDRFSFGSRAFLTTTVNISPRFVASYFITTAVGANRVLPQRTLMNLIFTYNVLTDLRRTGLF